MIRKTQASSPDRVEQAFGVRRVQFMSITAIMALWMPASVLGQEFSGFLGDYSEFKETVERVFVYETESGIDALASYHAIMVDQPLIIVASDSKYKAMKPDDMKLISDALRMVLVQQLERSNFRLVTTPGPNTLYLHTAITDLYLKKKGKRLIQFTPVGIATTLATTPFKDVMDKINLQQVTFEAELLDSLNEERLGAIVEREGSATDKKQATSWNEFLEGLELTATRLACRLNNAALADHARRNCMLEYPL